MLVVFSCQPEAPAIWMIWHQCYCVSHVPMLVLHRVSQHGSDQCRPCPGWEAHHNAACGLLPIGRSSLLCIGYGEVHWRCCGASSACWRCNRGLQAARGSCKAARTAGHKAWAEASQAQGCGGYDDSQRFALQMEQIGAPCLGILHGTNHHPEESMLPGVIRPLVPAAGQAQLEHDICNGWLRKLAVQDASLTL